MTHLQRLEYQRKYNLEHKGQAHAYYLKNKKKINAYSKRYYQRNKGMWTDVYNPDAQARAIIKGANEIQAANHNHN